MPFARDLDGQESVMPRMCPHCRQCVVAPESATCPGCGCDTATDGAAAPPSNDAAEVPQRIGRYDIRGAIGCGATATVYRGYDIGLQREVAIKVPRAHLVASQETANAFLTEARTLARLDHPNILPIFDLGRTDDRLCFLVCKLFEGHSLKQRLTQGRPTVAQTVEWTRCLAEALDYAHRQGLVHRDVKPANVLLDAEDRPVLADFDLALHPHDFGKGPTFVGTVSYMSPEQARREGHRVDARTDVYSLGVVLYEMLTGRLPFESNERDDLLEQIRSRAPLPLRQLDAAIPAELERICLKAMAKLPSERYASAAAMAEELRQFSLEARVPAAGNRLPDAAAAAPPAVRSRGLSAFGSRDADFYPELLPGPHDRVGLPEIIRFWKDRLDCVDPEGAFRVGLMLGPTGSGKSSLLQAGVLPRLASSVCAVRVECTPDDTETRLAAALRQHRPELPAGGTLAEAIGRLRLGEGGRASDKVLIVLDQFEQWLHAQREFTDTPLVAGLRQCDGVHVQALLLVRDDFGLAAARFLHELEVPIVGGVNFGTVDRFDPSHARKVLASFGRACAALPPFPEPLTAAQEDFLSQAVEELTEQGRVIPVRLVLLAEMMKSRPWTAAALRDVGGATGSAVVFLEESLGRRAVNPAHRRFHAPACAVLHTLLPARGEKLKGMKRSRQELLDASGLSHDPAAFDAMLSLLSGELRLITPTEQATSPALAPAAFFQLTHDYLIAPLRLWLTRQQRATRRGRAQLHLAEFADDWDALRENRRLPDAWTWATVTLLTRRQDWTTPQRAMMRVATRHYLTRGLVALGVILLLLQGWRYLARQQAAELAAQHAADEVAQLRTAPVRNVPGILQRMEQNWAECEPRLRAALDDPRLDPQAERNVRIALLGSDSGQVEPLVHRMLEAARPNELVVLREVLMPRRRQLTPGLWRIVEAPHEDGQRRLRAAVALAEFDPKSPRWAKTGESVTHVLLTENPLDLNLWLDALRPVRQALLPTLAKVFRDPDDPGHAEIVARVLADYAADDPALLLDLMLSATPSQYPILWPVFRAQPPTALAALNQALAVAPAEGAEADRRRAQAAVMLLQLGHPDRVWPLLRHRPDPSVRSWLVYLLGAPSTDPRLLVDRCRQEEDISIRRALVLSLGGCDPQRLEPDYRRQVVTEWLDLYRDHPDAGLHAAIDWTLRQRWKHEAEIAAIDRGLAGKRWGKRAWLVNGQGQTLAVFARDRELPAEGPERSGTRIPRAFAMGTKDVTVAEFNRFQKAYPAYRYPDFPTEYLEGPTSPMIYLTWFDAAAYCRWLSEKEGIAEEEMCYPPLGQIRPGMKMPANYLSRTGYRLPTAIEWQYASRAGAATPRYFGRGDGLVAQFGWYANVAAAHVHPVGSLKPSDFGLFDVYGNVWEWSHDRAWRPDAKEDREDDQPINHDQARLTFGGSFADQASALRSTSFVPRKPGECHSQYGMRLARTLR